MPGQLFLVSTPIGNLDDLSPRAVETLRRAALIVCEDTRVTRKLLDRFEIEGPTAAFHAHSTEAQLERLLERLEAGEDLAVVSDAGTPLVSDPGERLVEGALARGATVVPIPGASAVLAALVGSGLRAQPFAFLGFLPRKPKDQREVLGPWAALDATLVFYEAPTRVGATLSQLATALGAERPACVARELTKRYENFERGTLGGLAAKYAEGARGEVVLVVGPPGEDASAPADEATLETEARRLLEAGTAPSEAAKTLAAAFGLRKKQAYAVVLSVSRPD